MASLKAIADDVGGPYNLQGLRAYLGYAPVGGLLEIQNFYLANYQLPNPPWDPPPGSGGGTIPT